jgi:5-methylcytosine-specific restriction endonuclease McrA
MTDPWQTFEVALTAAIDSMVNAYATRHKVGFYESPAWRAVRYQALKRSGGCCQCCGERASKGRPLHVDHIKPRSRYPALELDPDNLQVLCVDCNLGKSNKDATDWRVA